MLIFFYLINYTHKTHPLLMILLMHKTQYNNDLTTTGKG